MTVDRYLKLRVGTGWVEVGTTQQPLNLRLPDNTWQAFGDGGGQPLKLRNTSGGWWIVSTAGIGGSISGTLWHHNGDIAPGYEVTITGPTPDITTTDSGGDYSFTGLEFGSYSVFVRITDYLTISASVTLSLSEPHAQVNLFIPAGISTFSETFNAASGWGAAYLTRSYQGPSTPTFAADALAGSSENFTDFGSQESGTNDLVTWLSVPIAAMRDFADAHVALTLASPVLSHIEVKFQINGNSYTWDGHDTTTSSDGIGSILYQGPTATGDTASLTWTAHSGEHITATIPVVRDMGYFKGDGETVWSGNLTDTLTAISVAHTLPGDYAYDAAQYHCFVSDAHHPASGLIQTNSMSVTTTVDFIYAYG